VSKSLLRVHIASRCVSLSQFVPGVTLPDVGGARSQDTACHGPTIAVHYGVLRADDAAVRASEEAVQAAGRSSNDVSLSLAQYTLRVAVLSRDAAADRHRGLDVMVQVRDMWLREHALFMVPVVDLFAARERARRGDRDAAIPVMRKAVTIWTRHDGSGMAFGAPAFWWRRCWSVAPRATWPKPKRRSTGWRTCRPTTVRRCSRSRCCGCARC
jgi:hypothetical protein